MTRVVRHAPRSPARLWQGASGHRAVAREVRGMSGAAAAAGGQQRRSRFDVI